MSARTPNWLNRFFQRHRPTKPVRRATRLGIESLEDRSVPATTITIQEAAGTLDGFLSATDGTINLSDLAGQPGTLSRGALQAIGAGIQVSITAENAILFDASLAGPVALQTNSTTNAQFLAVNGSLTFAPGTSVTTNAADITFSSTNGALTLGGVSTGGGNINLIADALDVLAGAAVNAGTNATRSVVTVRPTTSATNIDLGGTGSVGTVGLTDTELDTITARLLQVGSASTTGTITISAPVSLANGSVPTLSLVTGNTTATAITHAAALTVTNLAVRSVGTVTLNTVANDVGTLAANVTGVGDDFLFTDSNALALGTVAGIAGITTGTAVGSVVTLSAGALTQAAGANVVTNGLELRGAGPVTLTNATNNVATLAANLTGALSYTDADALSIGTAGTTSSISTNNGDVTIATTDGDLSVTDGNGSAAADVVAGTGAVSLTAGSAVGQNRLLNIATNAGVTGFGGITLTADNINIGAQIFAGAQLILIQQFKAGTPINLGNSVAVGTLALNDGEIDRLVTSSAVRIGNSAAGNLDVSAPITVGGTNQLELVTGGAVLDNNTGGTDITVTRLAITAVTGIGVAGTDSPVLDVAVSNLEATTATGGISIGNTDPLTIGGVTSALTGVSVTTSGNLLISSATDIAVTEAVSVTGTGTLTVTADADANGSGVFSNTAALTTTGDITIRGADIDLGAAVSTTNTAGGGQVFLLTSRPTDSVQLGTDVGFGLTDADLNQINAAVLNIGSAATNTAGIQTTSQITLSALKVPVLSLETAGAIVDSTGGEQTDITVQSLALRAENGIGSGGRGDPGDLEVAVTFLAVANVNQGTAPTGDINIFNTGSLTIASAVDGLNGVTNAAPLGNVTIGTGSPLIIDAPVADTSGGDIDLFTTGADGDITQTVNGNISATGGNGNITLDTSGATSGGAITINPNSNLPSDIVAAGTGAITITARTSVTFAVAGGFGAVVASGDGVAGGDVTVTANVGNVNGTADITLGAGSSILTRGTITLDADPDANGIGGAVFLASTAVLTGPGATLAAAINIRSGQDITLATLSAAGDISVVTSAAILDDGDDTTSLTATNIFLTAGGRIGGSAAITTADLESASGTPSAAYLGALDVAYTGTLSLTQAAPGNVQIRKTGAGLNTSSVTINNPTTFVGTGNQFALISSGGNLTVDNAFAIDPANNANVLLATTGAAGNDVAFTTGTFTNSGATATTTIAATGAVAASVNGPVANNVAEVVATNLVLFTTGGAVGAIGAPVEFDAAVLNGRTTGSINGAAQAGGTAVLKDTANGLQVGQFTAGTGDVTLTLLGNATASLTAVAPNDNVAEIIGATVTLDTTAAAANAATGQIGRLNGVTVEFFEVNATTLNASTNNSQLWVSEVGTAGTAGAALGLVSAGTDTANLRVRNGGSLTSAGTLGVPDVVAATVVLSAPEGGSFGTAGAQLEIDATTLIASVTGTGVINVVDTAGGLTVQQASTTGNVSIVADTGALTLGNGTSTGSVVTATGGIASLSATTAITSGATGAVLDVTATSLNLLSGAAIGVVGTPIETAVTNLAAGGTDLFLANTGALTVTTVDGTIGIGTTGTVTVTTTGSLAVADNVTGAGVITLTVTDAAGTGDNLTVNATKSVSTSGTTINLSAGDAIVINGALATAAAGTVNLTVDAGAVDVGAGGAVTVAASATVTGATSVNVTGGTDGDTFNLKPLPTPITVTVTAAAGTDALNLDLTGATTPALNVTGVGVGTFAFGNRGSVTYTGLETQNALNGALALNLDLNVAGFQDANASPDVTTASASNGVLSVTVQGNSTGAAQPLFNGSAAGVGSLTIAGSSDRDTVIIDLTNPGVPAVTVTGGAPAVVPGDTLNLVTTNATGVAFAPAAGGGTYTFANRNAITFSQIETVPAPIVSILATDSFATEGATLDTGTFTFTRAGDLSAALTVNFTLTGTAANGTAYQTIPLAVTFAPGAATATVTLTPRDNSQVDGTRSAVLTLAPGAAYGIDAGRTIAVVTIADNDTEPRRLVVGSSSLGTVAVFDNGSPTATRMFNPYVGYVGGVSVAVGDVNGDGVPDIVTGATDLSSHVKVFDGVTGAEIASFFAFTNFNNGVGVAVGDLDNDGRAEIIIGALTVAPHVKVFSFAGGAPTEIASYYAFLNADGTFVSTGISVAAGDLDGDGRAEIIVGAKIAPAVKVFSGAGALRASFLVPNLAPTTGITVGAGDLDGDRIAEILVGSSFNGLGAVTTLRGDGSLREQAILGAVPVTPSVAAGEQTGDNVEELYLTVGPTVSVRNGTTFAELTTLTPFIGFRGGVFVG